MKKLIFKSTILSVVAIIGFLAGCKKDTDPNVGTPQVTDFTPAAGGPVGTYMTVSGTFFSTADKTTVTVGGATATILTIDQANITLQVPTGAATGKITVTVNGYTGSSTKDFTVTTGTPAPKIIGFDPTSGLGADAASIKIKGYNFSATSNLNKVEFAAPSSATIVGTVTAATTTQLTVTVPSGAITGKVKVSVLASAGGAVLASGTSGDDFSVPAPAVSSIAPTFSVAGANIVVNGSNFSKTAANNTVKFNGVTATVVSVNGDANQLIVTAPVSTTGKVSVTVGGQTGNGPDFIYPVTFTSVADNGLVPATITSAAVGATVNIMGTNFSPSTDGNSVKFNGTSAKVTAATNTMITVTVPAGASTGKVSVQVGGSPEIKSASDFTITP